MAGSWIQTFLGVPFYPLDPRLEDIHIVDIAHALSNLCRFTGHTREFYSVAQHCAMLSYQVPEEDALWGLLHDASEAYLCDLARPIKHQPELDHYRVAEADLQRQICLRFGLATEQPASVHHADKRMLATERAQLMSKCNTSWELTAEPYPDLVINPWQPKAAKAFFLNRFREITDGTFFEELALLMRKEVSNA